MNDLNMIDDLQQQRKKMASKKKKIPQLQVEHLSSKINQHLCSLLEYRKDNYLCVIDNITPSEVSAYVLDYAEQTDIHLNEFLSAAIFWFYHRSEQHQLSVELAIMGLTESFSPMLRTFDTTHVTRILGYPFSYEVHPMKVKRRRIVPIPEGVMVKLKKAND